MATSIDHIPGVDTPKPARKARTRKAKPTPEVREESQPQAQGATSSAREDLEKEELKHAYEREKQENESLRAALEIARTEFANYANGVSGPLAWVLVYRNPGTLQGEMFFSPAFSDPGEIVGLLQEVGQRFIEEHGT